MCCEMDARRLHSSWLEVVMVLVLTFASVVGLTTQTTTTTKRILPLHAAGLRLELLQVVGLRGGQFKPNCLKAFEEQEDYRLIADETLESFELNLINYMFKVYRHGDRTPTKTFPTDPNADVWWKLGLGQLTNVGKMQHYVLGGFLRQRYAPGHLSPSYDRNEVYVQSTDMDRTLMSAQANLAALYPPEGAQLWNPDLLWQPIPVHTLPTSIDYVFDDVAECPRYEQLWDKEMASPEMQAFDQRNKDVYTMLTNVTGRTVDNIKAVSSIYSNILAARCHNLTIPEWVTESLNARMLVCHNLKFVFIGKTQQMQRLLGGPVWGRLLDNIRNKINGTTPMRKAFFYSSHDTVIAATMSGLGIFNGIAPPYAAALFVELLENDAGYRFVQFAYRNTTNAEAPLIVLTVPGCSGLSLCPLDILESLTKDILSDDVVAECHEPLN